jgi:MYXO-CTERM domain-containing protein
MSHTTKTLLTAAVVATAGLATFASGAVISTSSNVNRIARPADARLNVLTNACIAKVWNERQNVALTQDLRVDAFMRGRLFDEVKDLQGKVLPKNLIVSSHYVHFDSPGTQHATLRQASITFDQPIVGVIMLNKQGSRSLDNTDAIFGMGTQFTKNLDLRGLELNPCGDRFKISNDGKTLTFWSTISNPGDYFRVITSGGNMIPTPGAAALLGLGGLAIARRRRTK